MCAAPYKMLFKKRDINEVVVYNEIRDQNDFLLVQFVLGFL